MMDFGGGGFGMDLDLLKQLSAGINQPPQFGSQPFQDAVGFEPPPAPLPGAPDAGAPQGGPASPGMGQSLMDAARAAPNGAPQSFGMSPFAPDSGGAPGAPAAPGRPLVPEAAAAKPGDMGFNQFGEDLSKRLGQGGQNARAAQGTPSPPGKNGQAPSAPDQGQRIAASQAATQEMQAGLMQGSPGMAAAGGIGGGGKPVAGGMGMPFGGGQVGMSPFAPIGGQGGAAPRRRMG